MMEIKILIVLPVVLNVLHVPLLKIVLFVPKEDKILHTANVQMGLLKIPPQNNVNKHIMVSNVQSQNMEKPNILS